MIAGDRGVLAREATITTLAAGSVAAVLLWAGPPGVDLAAHAYQRTLLLHHGFVLWNNFWYAGRYSFVTYSFIYYPLAAILGIKALAVATISAAALAFTLLVWREWGPVGRLPSRTFAVVWAGIALSAAFPFALGIALALLAMTGLQRGHRRVFAVLALLALLASPLAFLLLAVVLTGLAYGARVKDVRFGAMVVLTGVLIEFALLRIFPEGGLFPFGAWELIPALIFSGFGLVATRGISAARPLRGIFGIYLAVCVVAYVVPSALGSNVERLRYAALPIALLVVALRRWQPRWLAVSAVVLATVWNVTPIATSFAQANSDPARSPAYWASTIAFLHQHLSPSYRVEAVDTVDHWPAEFLPAAGIPIVRGWYRQADFPENALLYDEHLSPERYSAWLQRLGVRYVVLSDAPPDYSSRIEEKLLRSGRSGLVPVFQSKHVTVLELPGARSLITGPGLASVKWLWPSRLVLAVDRPGRYRLALRWSPYWHTHQGCVSKGSDGMVRLSVRRAGLVDLSISANISRGLEALAGVTPKSSCG